ncbi:MAG: DUF6531 domain-containing protein [Planctomycetes bacterium]|nr:DUF6531 domain-containing protein [Planctomycetota bacterium]
MHHRTPRRPFQAKVWFSALALLAAVASRVDAAPQGGPTCRGFILYDHETSQAQFPGCIMWLPKKDPDPVDLATGAYLMDELDSTLPGVAGHDFEFRRYYDGGLNIDGPLGQKWDSPVFRRIHEAGSGLPIVYCSGRGRSETFTPLQTTSTLVTFQTPAGLFYSLEKRLGAGLWTYNLVDAGGNTDVFEPTVATGVGSWFRLRESSDPHGNKIRFAYDGQDRLTSITDSTSGVHTLKYMGAGANQSRLASYTDAADRTTSYEYDATGNLIAVVRPATAKFPKGTKDTYTYFSGSRIESATQAGKPKPYLVNTYDSNGRVVAQQFGESQQLCTIDYSAFPWVTVTDREGNVVDYLVDASSHHILRRVEHDPVTGATSTTIFTFDSQGHRNDVLMADGRIQHYTYDVTNSDPRSRSNLLSVEVKSSASDPHPHKTSWTYTSAFNRVATKTSARMNALYGGAAPLTASTRFVYTPQGDLSQVTFPDVTTPNGTQIISLQFQYDAFGRLTKRIEPNGSQSTYAYSGVKLEPFAQVETRDIGGAAISTAYTYNKAHSPLTVDSNCACPTGGHVAYVYDARNDLIEVRRTVDANTTQVAQFEYDENGNVVRRRDADDSPVGDGWATRDFTYDRLNNVTKIVEDVDASTRLTTTFVYDAKERLTKLTDADGATIEYGYDHRDDLVELRRLGVASNPSDDIVTAYEHDSVGRLSGIVDARSKHTTLQYGPYGLLERVTHPLGSYSVATFDEDDNVTAMRVYDASNQLIDETLNAFDEQNRTIETKDLYRRADGTPVGDGYLTVDFEYDAMGNMTLQEREDGSRLIIAYDSLGRPQSVRDSVLPSNGWNFDYGSDGALEAAWKVDGDDRTGASTTRLVGRILQKDGVGRPLVVEDALGHQRAFEWSLSGDVTRLVDRAGRASTTAYDELGRVILDTREVTATALGASGPISTLRTYQGTLLAAVSALTGGVNDETTQFQHDAFGRTTGVTYGDGTIELVEYDAMSNVVKSIDPSQNVVSATYDALNRLTQFSVATAPGIAGETFGIFGYDARGHTVSARNDDYLVTRTYNSLDSMESETVSPTNIAWSKTIKAEYDTVGRTSRVFYPAHTAAVPDYAQYTWDGIDRLREVRKFEGAANRVVATYSYLGEFPVTEQSPSRSTARDYDVLRRLISLDHSASGRPIASIDLQYDPEGKVIGSFREFYDASGNPIAPKMYDGGVLYQYDDAGELQRSQSGLTQAQYAAADPTNAKLVESYAFDRVWNLTSRATQRGVVGTVVAFVSNLVNEYVQIAGLTQVYDANGNLVSQNGGAAVTYDHRDLPLTLPFAPNDLRMKYDVFGRRIETWAGQSSQSELVTYWDWQAMARTATVGATTKEYEYHFGNELDHLLETSDRSSGTVSLLFGNEVESLIATSDFSGNVTESFRYNDFGKRTRANVSNGNLLADPAPSVFNQQIGFQGRWTVAGVEKYLDFRNRIYLPEWGRFAQQDPLGFVDGSMNRYQLGTNDPHRRDPFGLVPPNDQGNPVTSTEKSKDHCGETLAACKKAGINDADTKAIVRANWGQDNGAREAGYQDARTGPTNGRFHAFGDEALRWEWYTHWWTVNHGMCSTEMMGVFLHFVQDMVYHRDTDGETFVHDFGHAWASRYCKKCRKGSKTKKRLGWWADKVTWGDAQCPDHPTDPAIIEAKNRLSILCSRMELEDWKNHCGNKGELDTWKDYDTNGRPPPSTPGPDGPPKGPSTGDPRGPGPHTDGGNPGPTGPGPSTGGDGGGAGPSTGGPAGPSTGAPKGPSTPKPSTPTPTGPSTGGPSGPSAGGPATGGGAGTPTGPSTGGGHGGSNAGKGKNKEKGKDKGKGKGKK